MPNHIAAFRSPVICTAKRHCSFSVLVVCTAKRQCSFSPSMLEGEKCTAMLIAVAPCAMHCDCTLPRQLCCSFIYLALCIAHGHMGHIHADI